ncbi:flagellar hook protein FlgE [Aquincola tertiaricarbonis]|uniref:flagellar hook protein FlgE n=1 Tax=Aquincola tertiaricarbonis TaxID=391953 RepID=UPI0006152C9F|nr:flagellar hook-basal body complex protein [Aquincola tertiaricarbonis]
MSFAIALSGINAINAELDTISNNIANSGTYGFKAGRANFASMYAGTQPTGAEVSSVTQTIEEGGGVMTTGRSMDASISGRGFFVSRDASGAMVYSRVGMFSVDKSGFVVDGSGRKVQGYAALEGSTALGALGDLTVPNGQIAAKATDSLKYVSNLSRDWTVPTITPFNPADPLTFNSSNVSVVYDSLGTKHSVTQYFVKTGTNAINVHYTFDGAAAAAPQALTFDTNGVLTSPTAAVSLNLGTPAGANPLVVSLDYTGTTQYAGEAVPTVNASNGYASGTLISTALDEDGSVMAQYSNGEKKRVGTLALAAFPAEGDLTPVSDTSWVASSASGEALMFAAGSGMTGKLTTGSIEQSNVDMTGELVGLMSAQRNYQANTKVLSTENEMMQALMQAV